MSTSITHHPVPFAVTGAVAAGVAAVAVVLSLAGSPSANVAPNDTSPAVTHSHHWRPTTAGGQVQLGE